MTCTLRALCQLTAVQTTRRVGGFRVFVLGDGVHSIKLLHYLPRCLIQTYRQQQLGLISSMYIRILDCISRNVLLLYFNDCRNGCFGTMCRNCFWPKHPAPFANCTTPAVDVGSRTANVCMPVHTGVVGRLTRPLPTHRVSHIIICLSEVRYPRSLEAWREELQGDPAKDFFCWKV